MMDATSGQALRADAWLPVLFFPSAMVTGDFQDGGYSVNLIPLVRTTLGIAPGQRMM